VSEIISASKVSDGVLTTGVLTEEWQRTISAPLPPYLCEHSDYNPARATSSVHGDKSGRSLRLVTHFM
jgi:hypothetical protein